VLKGEKIIRRLQLGCSIRKPAPSENQSTYLYLPPSREEIELKLQRATNTAPKMDGIEYCHIRALDPTWPPTRNHIRKSMAAGDS
jgi:hypothetical protein